MPASEDEALVEQENSRGMPRSYQNLGLIPISKRSTRTRRSSLKKPQEILEASYEQGAAALQRRSSMLEAAAVMTPCILHGTSSCLWEGEQNLTIYKAGELPRVFAETRLPGTGSRKKPAPQKENQMEKSMENKRKLWLYKEVA